MAPEAPSGPQASPFRLDRPARQRVPFLFASPHSGRSYPASLLERTRLDATTLRRSEDAFVDELFAGAVGLGAPLLAAHFPRAFLDVNRGIAELDAGMFDGALGVPVDTPRWCMARSPRAAMRCKSKSTARSIWTKTRSPKRPRLNRCAHA